jgi:hypothetical protein
MLTVVQPSWCVVLAVVTGMPRPLWIAMIAVTAGMCALVVASALRTPWRRRLGRTIALAAAVAVLAGPALFAVQVVDAARDGSGGDAYVGVKHDDPRAAVAASFRPSPPQVWGGAPGITPPLVELVAAARAAGGGRDGAPLFLTDSWSIAAPVIDATGDEVLTDGGYSGQAVVFTAAEITAKIRTGVHLIVVRDHAPRAIRSPTPCAPRLVGRCTPGHPHRPAPTRSRPRPAAERAGSRSTPAPDAASPPPERAGASCDGSRE